MLNWALYEFVTNLISVIYVSQLQDELSKEINEIEEQKKKVAEEQKKADDRLAELKKEKQKRTIPKITVGELELTLLIYFLWVSGNLTNIT